MYLSCPSNLSISHHFLLSLVSADTLPPMSTMAAIHSPPPALPTPSSSDGRRSTAPAAPKLRDSCQVCASSKLKCSKEKPTCSRCAKRGLICEYVTSKRWGRKHEDRSRNNSGSNTSPKSTPTNTIYGTQPLPPPNSWFAPNSTISSTDPVPSPGVVHPSSRASTSGASSDLFPSLLSPVDQSLSSTLTDSITDLNNSFASPIFFSVPDLPDSDILGQSHVFSTGVDGSSNGSTNLFDTFPVSEDAMSDLLALSTPRSPSNSRASTYSDAQSYQGPRVADAPCFCLVRALGLMEQLFLKPSTPCTTSATQGLDKDITVPTIQAVMAKNEHTIEDVSTMLRCSCSQDGYLLTIMSLIVFKVLSWYAAAAAARKTPSSSSGKQSVQSSDSSYSRHSSLSEQVVQDPVVIGSYSLEGEDSARMARQLVLSELHRVQRLLNQLSTKLKAQAAKSGADTPNSLGGGDSDSETTLPLSGLMLDQLGVDLRKQLKALSLEIVEGLRGE